MAGRTSSLMDALAHPGFEVLRTLVNSGPMTEDELTKTISDASQPTMNRRLHELRGLDLVERAPGARQQRGRVWHLTRPDEAHRLVEAAHRLAVVCAEYRVAAAHSEERTLAEAPRDRALREVQ